MSEIEEHLKDEERDFWISDPERVMLLEILACVSVVLRNGKLYFNRPGPENNEKYAAFCDEIARRFANMPVEKEQ